MLKMFESKLQ